LSEQLGKWSDSPAHADTQIIMQGIMSSPVITSYARCHFTSWIGALNFYILSRISLLNQVDGGKPYASNTRKCKHIISS